MKNLSELCMHNLNQVEGEDPQVWYEFVQGYFSYLKKVSFPKKFSREDFQKIIDRNTLTLEDLTFASIDLRGCPSKIFDKFQMEY